MDWDEKSSTSKDWDENFPFRRKGMQKYSPSKDWEEQLSQAKDDSKQSAKGTQSSYQKDVNPNLDDDTEDSGLDT